MIVKTELRKGTLRWIRPMQPFKVPGRRRIKETCKRDKMKGNKREKEEKVSVRVGKSRERDRKGNAEKREDKASD